MLDFIVETAVSKCLKEWVAMLRRAMLFGHRGVVIDDIEEADL